MTTRTMSRLFIASLLLLSAPAFAQWELTGGDQGLGKKVPSSIIKIVVTGDSGVGDALLSVGPTHWFGWPHYAWYDHTDDTVDMLKEEIVFLDKIGDFDAADTIYHSLATGAGAKIELRCTFVTSEKAYRVIAINHESGAWESAWVDPYLLLLVPLKALQPVLQALVNVK